MPAGSECCFSQCEEFQHPEEEFTEKSETTNNSNCEQPLYKPQNLYKQLWVIKQTYVHASSEYEFIGVIFDCQSLCSWFCVVFCRRREHSLLLDVMLVLYRREWFLQDCHSIRQTYTQEVWTEAWGYRLKTVLVCEWMREVESKSYPVWIIVKA